MSLDFTDDQSTMVQAMAWCRQATSHYLSQCWPRSLLPYGVSRPEWVNSLVPERCGNNFKSNAFRNLIFRIVAWTFSVILLSGECHRTSLMRSQHWIRQWLGAIRQQAITWANIDLVLWSHITRPHWVNYLFSRQIFKLTLQGILFLFK